MPKVSLVDANKKLESWSLIVESRLDSKGAMQIKAEFMPAENFEMNVLQEKIKIKNSWVSKSTCGNQIRDNIGSSIVREIHKACFSSAFRNVVKFSGLNWYNIITF